MGGLETNCRLVLNYGSVCGDLRLTRDYAVPNEYYFEFERAWIRWQPSVSAELEIGFAGLDHTLRGQLFSTLRENAATTRQYPAPLFHQCFLLQWLNVIAAHEGREALRMTGEDAARSLAMVEKCYRSRSFMEPPWFTDAEKRRARELHQEVSS